jgi:DNA-binding transcriptional LysR family regulator
MDKLLAMQSFVRVVEAGNFSKASDLLGLPKSSVTRMIQGLERDLRVKLLERSTRNVRLTAEGSAYYEGALAVLGQVTELDAQVSHASATPRGRLKVNISGSIAYMMIIPELPTFFARYPDIQLDIGISNRSIDLITENIDCVIRVGPLLSDLLIARKLGLLKMVTCASPGYIASHPPLKHPRDLEHDHSIVHVASPRTGRNLSVTFEQDDTRVVAVGHHHVSVNDSVGALYCVRAGLGVLSSYEFMLREDIRRGTLVQVLGDWSNGYKEVHAAYPMNRHLPRKVRAFVDWVAEMFSAKGVARSDRPPHA